MASLTARRRSYVGVTVTLTSADTPYRLLDLVNTIIAAEANMPTPPMVCADAAGQVVLQADPANADTSGDILIGDALVSTTRMAYDLPKGASRSYNSPNNQIQFGSLYAFSHTAGQKLNVEVMTF